MCESKNIPIYSKRLQLLSEEMKEDKSEGFTIQKLTDYTGVSSSSWAKLLSGETINPKLDTLEILAGFFGVTVSYLIGESECRQLDIQAGMDIMEKLGFTEDMIATLKIVKENSGDKWRIYTEGLEYLLTDFMEDNTLPLLYSIGDYLSNLPSTGKNIVNSEDLKRLEYALEDNSISNESIKKQIAELIKRKEEYSIENLESYRFQQVTYELQKIRERQTKGMIEVIKLMSGKKTKKGLTKMLEDGFEYSGNKPMDVTFFSEKELE